MEPNTDTDVDLPALPGVFAAVLAAVALIAAVVAIVLSIPALGLVSGSLAVVLAGAVIWLNSQLGAMASKARGFSNEIIRLKAINAEQANQAQEQAEQLAEKQVIESVQADLVVDDTSDLADSETGLLGERYFVVTLEARVAAARRHLRPLALVLIDAARTNEDDPQSLETRTTAEIIRETLRDADTLCRLFNGQFAILLEDTPENGAIWTVERIRRRLTEQVEDTTVWAGIACYPANGFDGPEVLDRARSALASAQEWRQDRTEVAEA